MSTVRSRPAKPRFLHSTGFRLLGETLVAAIIAVICLVPLVTALAGIALAARHLRRHVDGEGDGIRLILADVQPALRSLLLPGCAVVLALGAVAFDLWLLTVVDVPGAAAVTVVLVVAASIGVLVGVRLAARWQPELPIRTQIRDAATLTRRDLTGSILIALAVGASVLFVWMYPPLVVIVGGLVSLAGVAVEMRRRERAVTAD